jgi:predicted DNA-binding antitoxin AbrB/MazE fold protein
MITISCQAVYANGVLRPLTPPALNEGEEVEVIILSQQRSPPVRTPGEIIAAIAALPVQGSGDPNTGRDHDRYLYGRDMP